MEVNEPTIAYGLKDARLEEVKSQIISVVQDMTDFNLLSQCYKLLKKHRSDSQEVKVDKMDGISDRVQKLVGIIPPFTQEEIDKDERLAYILGK
jgi:hypothetical protein